MRRTWLVLRLTLAAYVACVGLVSGPYSNQLPGRADVLVVPGMQVMANGVPSEELMNRLVIAERLYLRGVAPRLILSGRVDGHGHDEAAVMKRWLRNTGLPEDRLLAHSGSSSPWSTADHVRRHLEATGGRRVMLVTDGFQVARWRWIFRRRGIDEVYWATPDRTRFDLEVRHLVEPLLWVRDAIAAPRGAPPPRLQGAAGPP